MSRSSRKRRATKRYVLLIAEGDLSESEVKELTAMVEGRSPKSKLIRVKGNPRAIIVRTTNEAAPGFRGLSSGLEVGGKTLASVLTSGAIGKLKRRATHPGANGKVHER